MIWRSLVGRRRQRLHNRPATPAGATWMCPATNISLSGLRMCVIELDRASLRTLIWVAPVAGDVDPGTSFSARSCVVKTHIEAWSLPLGPAARRRCWPGLVPLAYD